MKFVLRSTKLVLCTNWSTSDSLSTKKGFYVKAARHELGKPFLVVRDCCRTNPRRFPVSWAGSVPNFGNIRRGVWDPTDPLDRSDAKLDILTCSVGQHCVESKKSLLGGYRVETPGHVEDTKLQDDGSAIIHRRDFLKATTCTTVNLPGTAKH